MSKEWDIYQLIDAQCRLRGHKEGVTTKDINIMLSMITNWANEWEVGEWHFYPNGLDFVYLDKYHRIGKMDYALTQLICDISDTIDVYIEGMWHPQFYPQHVSYKGTSPCYGE